MAKMGFSQINVKAATLTGAVLGLLCWLGGAVLYSYTGLGASFFHNLTLISILSGVVLGAIGGALLSAIYNFFLSIRW